MDEVIDELIEYTNEIARRMARQPISLTQIMYNYMEDEDYGILVYDMGIYEHELLQLMYDKNNRKVEGIDEAILDIVSWELDMARHEITPHDKEGASKYYDAVEHIIDMVEEVLQNMDIKQLEEDVIGEYIERIHGIYEY